MVAFHEWAVKDSNLRLLGLRIPYGPSPRAGWVGECKAALLGVDLGDIVDADQQPRSPEQPGADFQCFGFVCCFAVADA
jgi:hypothetical protein